MSNVVLGRNLKTIGYRAFDGCTSLTEIVLPDYVTTLINSFGTSETFRNCTSLKKVTLGKRISSMGTAVFSGCSNLQEVVINDGLSVISENCFSGCTAIKTITNYCVELPTTSTKAFPSTIYNTAALYIPEASYATYTATEPWSNFKNISTIEGGIPEPDVKKCATPVISYEDGVISFSCDTEDVEFVSEVKCPDISKYISATIPVTAVYTVTVYAKKAGYENSDVATEDIVISTDGLRGDVNKDFIVNGTDIQEVINIIVNRE